MNAVSGIGRYDLKSTFLMNESIYCLIYSKALRCFLPLYLQQLEIQRNIGEVIQVFMNLPRPASCHNNIHLR